MADYYPILVRAVSSLPNNNARARQELYERARSIVIEQLRRRDPQEIAPETRQEQAALETAIGRVEAQLRSAQTQTAKHPPPARPAANRTAIAGGEVRSKTTTGYFAKIARALRSNERRDERLKIIDRSTTNRTNLPVAAAPAKAIEPSENWRRNAAVAMGEVPNSLGTMLLAIAYGVTAMAFTGVVYFRGAVRVSMGTIGYPILLAVTALVLGLFIVLPLVFFRKTSTLSTIGVLFRVIHSASRRVS